MIIRVNKLALISIISFSGYYITKMPLSPIYVFVVIGLILSLASIAISFKVYMNKIIVIAIIFLIYILLSEWLLMTANISPISNFIISIVVFVSVYTISYKSRSDIIINASEKMIYFSLPLLAYEAWYRISNPVFYVDFASRNRPDLEFYYFKYNSVMYMDSNFVGIFVLMLIFFLLYIKQYTNKNYYILFAMLITLDILSISRASIIAMLIFLLLYPFRLHFYRYKKILLTISILIVPFLFMIKFDMLHVTDDSLSTKFDIIERTNKYFTEANYIDKVFGVGFGNAFQVLDIGAHNIFVGYLVESGAVGLMLFIYLWSRILFDSKYKAGIVMFPYLLNGMSLSSIANPYLYAMFAVILVLEKKKLMYGE